jgi:hypothetical protein
MPGATPSFPDFQEWQKLSEREQDALLDRLEGVPRRGRALSRLLSIAGCIALFAVGGMLLVF